MPATSIPAPRDRARATGRVLFWRNQLSMCKRDLARVRLHRKRLRKLGVNDTAVQAATSDIERLRAVVRIADGALCDALAEAYRLGGPAVAYGEMVTTGPVS